MRQLGPVNIEVMREDTEEGLCNIHVNNLKACYPTAAEIDKQEKQNTVRHFLGGLMRRTSSAWIRLHFTDHGLSFHGGGSVAEYLIHATLIAIKVCFYSVFLQSDVSCHERNFQFTSVSRQCGSGSCAYRVLTESMAKRVRNRRRHRHVSSRRVKVE